MLLEAGQSFTGDWQCSAMRITSSTSSASVRARHPLRASSCCMPDLSNPPTPLHDLHVLPERVPTLPPGPRGRRLPCCEDGTGWVRVELYVLGGEPGGHELHRPRTLGGLRHSDRGCAGADPGRTCALGESLRHQSAAPATSTVWASERSAGSRRISWQEWRCTRPWARWVTGAKYGCWSSCSPLSRRHHQERQ